MTIQSFKVFHIEEIFLAFDSSSSSIPISNSRGIFQEGKFQSKPLFIIKKILNFILINCLHTAEIHSISPLSDRNYRWQLQCSYKIAGQDKMDDVFWTCFVLGKLSSYLCFLMVWCSASVLCTRPVTDCNKKDIGPASTTASKPQNLNI